MKNNLKWILLAAVFTFFLSIPVYAEYAEPEWFPIDFYVIVNSQTGSLNVRSSPGLDYDTVGEMYNGEIVKIAGLEYNPNDGLLWGRCNHSYSSQWISLRNTSILRTGQYSPPDFYVVTDDPSGSVELKSGSGQDSVTISRIDNKNILHITDLVYNENDGQFWAYTSWEDQAGWISMAQIYVVDYIWTQSLDITSDDVWDVSGAQIVLMEVSGISPKRDYQYLQDVPKYAVITRVEANGAIAWKVTTDTIYGRDIGWSLFGIAGNVLYYNDDSTIYAADLSTGQTIWTNPDLSQVARSDDRYTDFAIGENGELFVCEGAGSDAFLAVDANGNTMLVSPRGESMYYRAEITDITYLEEGIRVTTQDEDGNTRNYLAPYTDGTAEGTIINPDGQNGETDTTEELTWQNIVEIPVGADRYKEAYLSVLRQEQAGFRMLENLRQGNEFLFLGNVILADIAGNETPELIYATVADETGTATISRSMELNYTHKAVIHIASYDSATGLVYDLMTIDAIGFNDEGGYACFGIWDDDIYTVDDEQSIYFKTLANWSGNVINVTEYQYNPATGIFEETNFLSVDPNSSTYMYNSAEKVQDEKIRRILLSYGSDPGVRLLIDDYGNTDYENMTYDEAIVWLSF